MALSIEDKFELQDIMGRYCHLMDDGDAAWADLFTEDGILAGALPDPVIGRDALRKLPGQVMGRSDGFYRHLLGSVVIDDAGENAAMVRVYNLVTDWREGGNLLRFSRASIDAVKTAEGWRLQRVQAY
ncbi:nuclear transport factor 2 family protein [Paraburkholderia sediminicola]|uniref:nuclear transport factor 2 family protein n=1 Tax=Paraburkholderia sp. D1E TaxID=3461398 RepID=UPI000EB48ACB